MFPFSNFLYIFFFYLLCQNFFFFSIWGWKINFVYQVEQLHKIFRLCGSPPEEFWKKSKLPHATIFKPHRPYVNSLYGTFQDLPRAAISLLETFLSVEPYKRGSATSALASEVSILLVLLFVLWYWDIFPPITFF